MKAYVEKGRVIIEPDERSELTFFCCLNFNGLSRGWTVTDNGANYSLTFPLDEINEYLMYFVLTEDLSVGSNSFSLNREEFRREIIKAVSDLEKKMKQSLTNP